MSWRDRIVRNHPAQQLVAAAPVPKAIGTIGTIGTIGNETFSATASHATRKKQDGSNHDPSAEEIQEPFAISAESANRAQTWHPVSESGNAVSAKSANSNLCAREKWGEAEEERAAIVEHDGGVPREWVEGFARLDPDRPPADVPPKRWQRFVDDVGRFLDSPFCAVAASLGWGPIDLFGCDRDKPWARIDQFGLLWLLDGANLLALTENAATIEMPTGARQTWRRKPNDLGRVLAWELPP